MRAKYIQLGTILFLFAALNTRGELIAFYDFEGDLTDANGNGLSAAVVSATVDGRSVRDIAGLLSLSEKAVESLLTRAREAFRATFTAMTKNLEAELS